jgi:hypothetical protein
LQIQAAWWAIPDPEFKYVDHEFILHWQVSDYIQDRFATATIYDGFDCKEGSNDITDDISDFYDNNIPLQNFGVRPDSGTPYNSNPATSGTGFRDIRLFLAVQPTAAELPIFYYTNDENQYRAKIDFCIRFSLYSDDPDAADSIEVNFQETLVTFYADLTDGFEVADVTAKPKNEVERTASIECEIIGYECDDDMQPLENPGYLR